MGCANQGRLELGMGGSLDNAKRAFEQACDFKQVSVACAANKVLFNGNRPFVPNSAEANDLMTRCNGGSARDCASIGIINIAMGNKPMGQAQIERACIQNEPLACAVKNKK
jgi:hypothetical protein